MKNILTRIGLIASFLCALNIAPADAASAVFKGTVVHISTNNIKVRDSHNKTVSFMVLPHFDQVFSGDGKTTYQMRSIHPGMFVRVYYDQHALGMRHADRVILLNAYGHGVKKIGS